MVNKSAQPRHIWGGGGGGGGGGVDRNAAEEFRDVRDVRDVRDGAAMNRTRNRQDDWCSRWYIERDSGRRRRRQWAVLDT